jgi:hypothetical protein
MRDIRICFVVFIVALFVLVVLVWYHGQTQDFPVPVVGCTGPQQLQCGDLLLVSGDWESSHLICRLTRMQFSHVAVCIQGAGNGERMILDAVRGRGTSAVTIQPLTNWLSEVVTWGSGASVYVRKLAWSSLSDRSFSDHASDIANRWIFADSYAWLVFLSVYPRKRYGFCSHLIGEVLFSSRGLWPGHFATHQLRKSIPQNKLWYVGTLSRLRL